MNILEYENYQEKKNHTTLDFPYNTYLCSIPLDFELVPPHWHDEMEIIYIKKGRGIVNVDFKEYHVSALTLVFILPGQLHSIEQYEVQYSIAKLIADTLVADGSTLQAGIGVIPDAVMANLKTHKGLGVNSEMFSDGMIDLIESGAITNENVLVLYIYSFIRNL